MLGTLPLKVIDLTSYYGVIRISGPDALSFLQGQLTCDVREIGSSSLQLGGFCTHQGRLRALFKLFKKRDPVKAQEVFYLELPKQLLPSILTHLKKYALFSKVVIEEELNIQIFGWQEKPVQSPPSDLEQSLLDPLKWTLPNIQNNVLNQISLLKAPGQLPRFQLIGPETWMAKLWEKFPHPTKYDGFNEWGLWDIRQGIPEIWLETTAQFFPHHLNLPHLKGVSFTKGCYCGQEIVARMHYRGNIKRRMVWGVLPNHNEANGTLPAGTELFIPGDQADTLKIITSVPFSGQIEVLVEIPNRLLVEPMATQTFKVRIGPTQFFTDLVVQPFCTLRE